MGIKLVLRNIEMNIQMEAKSVIKEKRHSSSKERGHILGEG